MAKENTLPVRALEGQKTLISRTMHSLAYDAVRDEIIVNSPLAQAILTFRGDANGEEAPTRVIQGPRTQIQGTDYDGNDQMSFDEVHGEIYIPVDRSKILTFSRDKLAKFKMPKSIDFIAEMPRDPNGKLYKRKLRDPYWEGRERAI